MQLKFLLIFAAFTVAAEVAGRDQCGSISEEQLIKQGNFAVPTEHQWLARIMYAVGKWKKHQNRQGAD